MKNFAKAEILGNIGNEVQLQQKEGTKYVQLAIGETVKNKNGEEKTNWHDVVAFNSLAELIAEYCKKGKAILVHGRLETNTFQDKDGITRKSYSIIANEVTFL